MRELSLFTGAGGGLLGSMLLGWRTVAAVEYEPYCQKVLCARGGYMAGQCPPCPHPDYHECGNYIGDAYDEDDITDNCIACIAYHGWRASFPVYGDIRDFDGTEWRGRCDIVTGGFPCQPFSVAGKQLGADDPRNMWPHTIRVLREIGAPLGFFENVPGLLSSGYFGTVLGDLAEAGFDAEWCVLGADDAGAPHRRKRLWILAYRGGGRLGTGERNIRSRESNASRISEEVPHTSRQRHEWTRRAWDRRTGFEDVSSTQSAAWERTDRGRDTDSWGIGSPWRIDPADWRPEWSTREYDQWLAEPYVGRVAHGVASRVDRLRALGNGQVPHTMAAAWTILARSAGLYWCG